MHPDGVYKLDAFVLDTVFAYDYVDIEKHYHKNLLGETNDIAFANDISVCLQWIYERLVYQ